MDNCRPPGEDRVIDDRRCYGGPDRSKESDIGIQCSARGITICHPTHRGYSRRARASVLCHALIRLPSTMMVPARNMQLNCSQLM